MGIVFNDVSYSYNGKKKEEFFKIKHINLDISKSGEYVVICGHTGSGKSTLVQHMNALMLPTDGSVEIMGTKLKGTKNKKIGHLRKKVGLVFQFPEYQLFDETVLKDIMFGPLNFGYTPELAEKKALEICKSLAIDEKLLSKSPFKLSGGQMRKVALAGILAFEPEILVLDEPTRGLDPRSREEVMEFIYKLHKVKNMSVVVITHDMELLAQYSTRVVVMKKGVKEFDGTKEDLFSTNKYEQYSLRLPKSVKLLKVLEEEFKLGLNVNKFTLDDLIEEIEVKLNGE